MKQERAYRHKQKDRKNLKREIITRKEIQKEKLDDIDNIEFIDDITFKYDGKIYISISQFGNRKVNPFAYSFRMIKRNGQFAYSHPQNFEEEQDSSLDKENFDTYIDILKTCNAKVTDAIFNKTYDTKFFPNYLFKTEHFYVFEDKKIQYKLLDKLDDPRYTYKILKDLYDLYLIYADAEILPGNNLDDYGYDAEGNLYFTNIENVVYNYFKTYRRYLYNLPKEIDDGTYLYNFIDFRYPEKSTERYKKHIMNIKAKEGIKNVFDVF